MFYSNNCLTGEFNTEMNSIYRHLFQKNVETGYELEFHEPKRLRICIFSTFIIIVKTAFNLV